MTDDEEIYNELATHDLFENLMNGNPLQIKHIANRLSDLGSAKVLMEQLVTQNSTDTLQFSGTFSGVEELFHSNEVLTEEITTF